MKTEDAAVALDAYTGHLLRLAHARAQSIGQRVLPADRGPRQFAVLAVLLENGTASQRQLGELLRVNRTLMVDLIDKLEQDGLVTRQRDAADRRAYALLLTPAGRRTIHRLHLKVSAGDALLTETLAPAEAADLNHDLQQLSPDPGLAGVPYLSGCTAFLITRAHHQLRERGRLALSEIGIEPRHFGALAALAAIEPCTQQQLATRLEVSPPIIVEIVDDLQRDDLISRVRQPADRRAYDLTITLAGKHKLEQAHLALDKVQQQLTDQLGATVHERLRQTLRRLCEVPAA